MEQLEEASHYGSHLGYCVFRLIDAGALATMRSSYPRREFITLAMSTLLVPRALGEGPTSSDGKFTKTAIKLVEKSEREDKFYGVVLVARGDNVLLRRAAGFADLSRNLRNSVEAPFPIESITKQFTAAAIMLLVENHKIALDDSILKFYPHAPPDWAGITIMHLLTHSSGISDQLFNSLSLDGIVSEPLPRDRRLLFQPGLGFEYSNAGYVLLAGVIAHRSGVSYEKFLTERVFLPLGMTHTGFHLRLGLKGYIPSAHGGLKEARVIGEPTGPDGAGSIYSTVDDMLTWSRAWDEGKILSASSRTAALTDYGHNYGFGWRFAPKFGRNLMWHTGSYGPAGFASIIDRFPDERLAFIVLTNALSRTGSTATMVIEGKETTFPANAARKLLEAVEALYFG